MNKGFTLIEMLVYNALLSILVAGSLLITYELMDAAQQIREKTVVAEEAHFILKKIDWAVTDANAIALPITGNSGPILSVDKVGFGGNPVVFDTNAGNIWISRGGGAPVILNTEQVTITSLLFEHIASSGTKPAAIHTVLVINGTPFEETRYVRQ